ncbi:MAG: hypothetical protein HY719_08535, partial [Planctomycetes bacterium]|nr:hypothetical protein [Planctomycetota bacterium]
MPALRLTALFLTCCGLLACGCGPIPLLIGGAYVETSDALKGGGTTVIAPPNSVPSVGVTTPNGSLVEPAAGDIALRYSVANAEGEKIALTVEWTADPAEPRAWKPATEKPGSPSEGTTNLLTTAAGTQHVFVWDSLADLGRVRATTVRLRVAAADSQKGLPAESDAFALDNNDVVVAKVIAPLAKDAPTSGDVPVRYTLTDPNGDAATAVAQWSVNGGVDYKNASERAGAPSQGLAALTSSPDGTEHLFIWDVVKDLGRRTLSSLLFRLIPSDVKSGSTGVSEPFTVKNNDAPVLTIEDITGKVSGNVKITWTATDTYEGTRLSVAADYSTDGGGTWKPATATLDTEKADVAVGASGVTKARFWTSEVDLSRAYVTNVKARVIVHDGVDASLPAVTASAFIVDNNDPPAVIFDALLDGGTFFGDVPIAYRLTDTN